MRFLDGKSAFFLTLLTMGFLVYFAAYAKNLRKHNITTAQAFSILLKLPASLKLELQQKIQNLDMPPPPRPP